MTQFYKETPKRNQGAKYNIGQITLTEIKELHLNNNIFF